MIDPQFGRLAPFGVHLRVGSGWGVSRPGHKHEGIDIGMPVGTPLLAMADGTVTWIQATPSGDAGIWIGIVHPSGFVSRYAHMSKVSVAKGQRVAKGVVVGYSGNTGSSTGPHVHVAIHVRPDLAPAVEAAVGRPVGGFGKTWPEYGVAIPAEPWVPVDDYRATTKARAVILGIPLWTSRRGGPPRRSPRWPILAGAGLFALFSVLLALGLRRQQR